MRRKKSKLTKAEVLNRAISSWEARQEGAVVMLRKSAEMLVKLRRQQERMRKRLATAESRAADELVASTIEAPEPTRVEADIPADPVADDIPGFLQRGAQAQAAVDKAIEQTAPAKPRRARRPKAETPTPQAGLDMSLAPADRTARMEAMGFHKTSRRR